MVERIKKAGYENIYVDCPHCRHENSYNRKSDLLTLQPISYMDIVTCQHCNEKFSINGDLYKEAIYKWFLKELYVLKEQKHFMLYIIFLCQACESFFEKAIINKKLERNKNIRDEDGFIDIDKYKEELKKLNIEKATFCKLRNIFLKEYEHPKNNKEACEAMNIIKETNINTLRNKVIHKTAYRPSVAEIEKFDLLIDALYFLGNEFVIIDSILILNE